MYRELLAANEYESASEYDRLLAFAREEYEEECAFEECMKECELEEYKKTCKK